MLVYGKEKDHIATPFFEISKTVRENLSTTFLEQNFTGNNFGPKHFLYVDSFWGAF